MINNDYTKSILREVLEVPTHSTREERMREFLIDYAVKNNIKYQVDKKGNVYFTKGEIQEGENYPCVVSHIDTVHRNQSELVEENIKLMLVNPDEDTLIAIDPLTYKQTGIGGDDKCGIAICLSIISSLDVVKGAFFVEEEIGMLGSRNVDREFISDCGYFIQFDAPTDNWVSKRCSGVTLFDDNFFDQIEPTLEEFEQTNISSDPFTDVLMLRQLSEVNCINFFAGYHRMHTPMEYVKISQVVKAAKLGYAVIEKLGLQRSLFQENVAENI